MTADGIGLMSPRQGRGGDEAELAGLIRARVERRVAGRILDLEVVCTEGRVTLQGRSRTQYAKQLAHQAVLDLAGGFPELANRIVVG